MTPELFWSRVDQSGGPDACWPWTMSCGTWGYGKTWVDSKFIDAHRQAFIYANGPIPAGRFICHKCDNPPCCNPAHLYAGTPADNSHDLVEKFRVAGDGDSCRHGHPYDQANTRINGTTGRRVCRACNRVSAHRVRARKLVTR